MENYWEEKGEQIKQAESVVTAGVPPPPQELKIRTFRSDLEALAKSGGALPHFEGIKIPQPQAKSAEEKENKNGAFWKIAAVVLAVVALVVAGYFFYSIFMNPSAEPVPQSAASQPSQPATAAPSQNAPTAPNFVHDSLFTKPADEVLPFVAQPKAENAAALKTFGQSMLGLLATAKKDAKFIEIAVQNTEGRDLSAYEVLELGDAVVLPQDTLFASFSPDPTYFAYRDAKGGFWPGVVLSLKTSENWLFLGDEVSRIEQSPKIENFFLKFPGSRSGGFADADISGQPARKLNFSSGLPAQAGASFIYGWFRGKLILSASEEGMKEALARL